MTESISRSAYRVYLDFLETAEKKPLMEHLRRYSMGQAG
jgi:hypothetical protein